MNDRSEAAYGESQERPVRRQLVADFAQRLQRPSLESPRRRDAPDVDQDERQQPSANDMDEQVAAETIADKRKASRQTERDRDRSGTEHGRGLPVPQRAIGESSGLFEPLEFALKGAEHATALM